VKLRRPGSRRRIERARPRQVYQGTKLPPTSYQLQRETSAEILLNHTDGRFHEFIPVSLWSLLRVRQPMQAHTRPFDYNYPNSSFNIQVHVTKRSINMDTCHSNASGLEVLFVACVFPGNTHSISPAAPHWS
jgi:hypothetical protein